jgi:hypothetical protein
LVLKLVLCFSDGLLMFGIGGLAGNVGSQS